MRMHHIVICGLNRSKIVFHVISQTARFYLKKRLLNVKMSVLREERKPTRCNNIDDILSIVDVDY